MHPLSSVLVVLVLRDQKLSYHHNKDIVLSTTDPILSW